MDTKKRNRNANSHPSYKKRGMSKASIAKKRAYDKAYSAKPSQKKRRAEMNRANRKAQKRGTARVGDRKDYDHAVGGMVSQKVNRGRNSKNSKRTTAGDRRARG